MKMSYRVTIRHLYWSLDLFDDHRQDACVTVKEAQRAALPIVQDASPGRLRPVGKKTLERTKVSFPGRRDKGSQQPSPLGRTHRPTAPDGDLFSRSFDKLACVSLAQVKDARDPPISIAERFAENVGGSFRGPEFFKQQEDGTLQGFIPFRFRSRVAAAVHAFREPRPDAGFAADPRGPGKVDGQSLRRGHQESGRVTDDTAIRGLPPQPHVLHNVLGLGRASHDPTGNTAQTGPQLAERHKTVIDRPAIHEEILRDRFLSVKAADGSGHQPRPVGSCHKSAGVFGPI